MEPGKHEKTVGRRPLKVREARFAKAIAKRLMQKDITPNQISIASVCFAGLSALCFYYYPHFHGPTAYLLLICAAAFIQGRLLCNLFDGMVAIEGGKKTKSGELFNDIPDRLSDPIILVALGQAVTVSSWGPTLGWFTALLAIMTAYIRTLSVSLGAPADFKGPMAKQHRMAIITTACFLTVIEEMIWHQSYTLLAALIIIAAGCLVTVWRRTLTTSTFLETQK
jgi:phosphatidylglycerophosphate synthase